MQVPATDAEGRPATPREVEVTTGLSDGTLTEILSGLSEGDQVIALPDNGVVRQESRAAFSVDDPRKDSERNNSPFAGISSVIVN